MNNQTRTSWLGVRLSATEHHKIKQRARSANLSMSEYVRHKALIDDTNRPIIHTDPETLKQLHVDLRRIGNNLNQLTRATHLGKHDSALRHELHEALSLVEQASMDVSAFLRDSRTHI